jgi:hypothetical protein
VSTLLHVYQQLCTDGLLPDNRQKDILTALRYLSSSYDMTPDTLPLTPEVEISYRQQLRDYLTAQRKGHSTIRNSIQGIGQYLKAFHQLQQTLPVPVARPKTPRWAEAHKAMGEASPYKHATWLTSSRYVRHLDQWPADLLTPFEKYRRLKRDQLRPATLQGHVFSLESHVGYLSMTADERLDHLPIEARKKLGLKRYKDDLDTITAPPVLSSWNDLFVLSHVQGFVAWHAWRIHTDTDAKVYERQPSKPSTLGKMVANVLTYVAETLKRTKDARILRDYADSLPMPRKIHNKAAECHSFTFAELEEVALAMMDEARRMDIHTLHNGKGYVECPGGIAAGRFQLGLVLMLGWRIPMRARNWCEALLETNLRKVNGGWFFHFEGDELKIATRRGETNVYEIEIPLEVVPCLEEYLNVWRPKLPRADEDRHVLLALRSGGGMLKPKDLYMKLKVHVYRHTKKRLYPHLLRTIFTSSMLSSGMDINSVAYGLNDNPATVLRAYNELQAGVHQQSLQDAYRRALSGHGNGTSR